MIRKTYDFRGGYATELSPTQIDPNMVLTGQNVYYKGKLKGRPGWTNLSTDATLHGGTIRGFTRAYINGAWYNVVALDDDSHVNFYYGNTGSYTAIDNDFDWTTGKQVEMVEFLGTVVAVNGTDKPAIIYYSSGWTLENLETYDTRTRENDEWYAGQWDDSETPAFVDDTTDAQSDTANDFAIATATNDDGFYVAGVTVFNKIVIKNCPDLGTSVTAEYAYYAGGGTWTTVTPTTAPAWTTTEADKTLEFDLPLGSDGTLLWKTYGDVTTQVDPTGVPGGALNRYIFRVRFTTADSAGSADGLEVYHTQYLTQILLNDKPSFVTKHQNRLWLFTGNAFRFSPPNQLTGWNSDEIEYCIEGGEKIVSACSCDGYLAVAKEAGIYQYIGTTTDNFVLRFSRVPGCVSARGMHSISGAPVYVAKDGIRVFMNGKSLVISRHIQSDFDSWTNSNAVVAEWEGDMLISFPTNSIILWADPDTLRQDDMGNGRVSFWKWSGLAAIQFFNAVGDGDNGQLLAAETTRFVKDTTNGYDVAYDTTQTAITQTLQTRYDTFDEPGVRKRIRRIKIDIAKSGDSTLTMYADEAQRSATATVESGTGTGHYVDDITPPYTMDGYDLSLKLVNATTNAFELFGISVEAYGRVF